MKYLCYFLVLLVSVATLKIKQLNVPTAVEHGLPVTLVCDFDLEGEVLYSVKWYKNLVEFYRFLPANIPHSATAIAMKGVNVDVPRCNSTHVFLTHTDLDSQGLYTCEVSTESPSYSTLKAEEIMQVYVLPTDEIEIQGNTLHTRLDSGDFINLTCVSPPSIPPATLTWFINGQVASNDQLIVYPIHVLTSGLERQQLGLLLKASSSLFASSNGVLRLRCTASLILTYEFDSLRILSSTLPSPSSSSSSSSSSFSSISSLTSSKLHQITPLQPPTPQALQVESHSHILHPHASSSHLHSSHPTSQHRLAISYLYSKPLSTSDQRVSVIKSTNYTHRRVKRITGENNLIQFTQVQGSNSDGDDDKGNYINGNTINHNHYGQRRHHSSSSPSSRHFNRQRHRQQQQLKHQQQQQQQFEQQQQYQHQRQVQQSTSDDEIESESYSPSHPSNVDRHLIDDNSATNWNHRESTDAFFYMNSANLLVQTPTRNSPLIDTKGDLTYKIGDWVNINCSTIAANAKLKWYINEVDTIYLSTREPVSVHEYTQFITSDSIKLYTLCLRFQLLPSHIGLSEIKLRCVATYKEVIREHSSSLNIFSYNYQAIEAQSTSFTSSSSSSSASASTSSSSFIINKRILLVLIILSSNVTAVGVSIFYSLFSYLIVLPQLTHLLILLVLPT